MPSLYWSLRTWGHPNDDVFSPPSETVMTTMTGALTGKMVLWKSRSNAYKKKLNRLRVNRKTSSL